jgi:hypothetical protein
MNSLEELLAFLSRLNARKIYYTIANTPFSARDEAIMVEVTVPGQRWEVEFFADGRVEVEIFISPGKIEGEEALTRLFEEFSD